MEIHNSESIVLSIIGNKTLIILISLYLHELEVLLPIHFKLKEENSLNQIACKIIIMLFRKLFIAAVCKNRNIISLKKHSTIY